MTVNKQIHDPFFFFVENNIIIIIMKELVVGPGTIDAASSVIQTLHIKNVCLLTSADVHG